MKKQILNLGKGLSKIEQRNVLGGGGPPQCTSDGVDDPCSAGTYCDVPKAECVPCELPYPYDPHPNCQLYTY